ncbi:iron chaperone [Paenibacillus sp. R14(2021)]|uniref:iron chaperone n=1 Tax=Paenibacillus sp. R14(2021) TaxID=2859228 RepID=UPI001C611F5F|nr:iron chaperone [Paenibacillus sp. R14(2021)]
MEVFAAYLASIDNPQHRARTEEVLTWVAENYPDLTPIISWNQPMFTDHGTYIIGFSAAKQHLAVAPERAGMIHFSDEIVQAGYDHSSQLVRMPWKSPIDYALLERMIEFNRLDKADCTTFWRK